MFKYNNLTNKPNRTYSQFKDGEESQNWGR